MPIQRSKYLYQYQDMATQKPKPKPKPNENVDLDRWLFCRMPPTAAKLRTIGLGGSRKAMAK